MAFEIPGGLITRPAAADLTASQFCFVLFDSSGNAALPSANGVVSGVLQNNPASGDAAAVATSGVSKISLGATVAAGVEVMTNSSGQAIAATSTNYQVGRTITGGVSGDIVALHILPAGKQ